MFFVVHTCDILCVACYRVLCFFVFHICEGGGACGDNICVHGGGACGDNMRVHGGACVPPHI